MGKLCPNHSNHNHQPKKLCLFGAEAVQVPCVQGPAAKALFIHQVKPVSRLVLEKGDNEK